MKIPWGNHGEFMRNTQTNHKEIKRRSEEIWGNHEESIRKPW